MVGISVIKQLIISFLVYSRLMAFGMEEVQRIQNDLGFRINNV
jgi:hypothetical protein